MKPYRRLTNHQLEALPIELRAAAVAFRTYLDAVLAKSSPDRVRDLGDQLENVIRDSEVLEPEMGTYRCITATCNGSTAH